MFRAQDNFDSLIEADNPNVQKKSLKKQKELHNATIQSAIQSSTCVRGPLKSFGGEDELMYKTNFTNQTTSPNCKQSETYSSPLMSYSQAQMQMLQGFGQYSNNSKMSKAYMQSHRSFNVDPEVEPTPRCCFFSNSKPITKKITKADLKKLNQGWNHNTLNKIEETFRTNNKTNVPEWLDGFQARVFQHASDLQERATEF